MDYSHTVVVHRRLVVVVRAVWRCRVVSLKGSVWDVGVEVVVNGVECTRRRFLVGKTRRHGGSVAKRWHLVVGLGFKRERKEKR